MNALYAFALNWDYGVGSRYRFRTGSSLIGCSGTHAAGAWEKLMSCIVLVVSSSSVSGGAKCLDLDNGCFGMPKV